MRSDNPAAFCKKHLCCRHSRAGRHLPPNGCKASGKTKKRRRRKLAFSRGVFMFSNSPWIIFDRILKFSFPQVSCGDNRVFPPKSFRKPESRGGTPLARGYGGRAGPCPPFFGEQLVFLTLFPRYAIIKQIFAAEKEG